MKLDQSSSGLLLVSTGRLHDSFEQIHHLQYPNSALLPYDHVVSSVLVGYFRLGLLGLVLTDPAVTSVVSLATALLERLQKVDCGVSRYDIKI